MGDKSVHTIGVKVLTKELMECNFKHTDAVLQSIENCRSIAAENHDEFNNRLINDPDDAIMTARGYNNAISILGSRGSGKTSIIMTLQYILRYSKTVWENKLEGKKELTENIMMPILVPQDFVRGQDLLSWVIVQLLEKADVVEKEINKCGNIRLGKQGPFARWVPEKCENQFSDPLRECMDTLRSSYELRYKIIKQSAGQTGHVCQYMDEIKRDANLVKHMLTLISMLTDYYRSCSREEREPLIFFVIDDLDLAPDRSQEVLNLVLRYLQHPNIVIICGWNQELFQTHLTMEVLRNQGVTDADMIEVNGDYVDVFMTRQRKRVSLLDSARRLSMDNLKKAFPPALRYEVRGFDTCQRAFFPNVELVKYKGKQEFGSLIDLIEKALLASHVPSRRKTDTYLKSTVEFLRTPHNDFIRVYMRIFDNKSRGLINTYHAFETLKEYFDKRDRSKPDDITPVLQSLLDTILFSNTHFFPYRRGLRDLIRIDKVQLFPESYRYKNICRFYCNYQQIVPVLSEYREKIESSKNVLFFNAEDVPKIESEYNYFPSLIIDVFILLNFMENLIRYICDLPLYEHGGHPFSTALNDVIQPIRIDAQHDSLLSYIIMSANIKEIPLFPETDNFRINLLLLDAYEKIQFRDGQYDFTGSYSYCCLSWAVSQLLSYGKPTASIISGEEQSINEKTNLQRILEQSRWTRTMNRLFSALQFNDNNVARLSRYRCFSLQGIFNEDEMIRESSIEQQGSSSEHIYRIPQNARHSMNNEELDSMVFSLREIETLETIVLKPLELNHNKDNKNEYIWNSIKSDPELFDRYVITKEVAIKFKEYIGKSKTKWIYNPIKLYISIKEISKSNTNMLKTNDDFKAEYVSNCERCLRDLKKIILWNLMTRLYYSFKDQYDLQPTRVEQYAYLLKASRAVSRYMERWEIGHQTWSPAEQEAVDKLQEIFQAVGATEALNLARTIAQYGAKIEEISQDEYSIALSELKQWFVNDSKYIRASIRSEINNQLQILLRSTRKDTKQYSIDNDIKEILAHLGRIIAGYSAEIAFCDELTKDVSSGERDRVTWPIIKEYREYFDNWKEEEMTQIQENEGLKNNTYFS